MGNVCSYRGAKDLILSYQLTRFLLIQSNTILGLVGWDWGNAYGRTIDRIKAQDRVNQGSFDVNWSCGTAH